MADDLNGGAVQVALNRELTTLLKVRGSGFTCVSLIFGILSDDLFSMSWHNSSGGYPHSPRGGLLGGGLRLRATSDLTVARESNVLGLLT